MKNYCRIVSILALTVFVASCAKEKKYEAVYKDKVFTTSAISTDPNDPYVYVPSMGESPMEVTASRPFWQGDQKLVTFRFEEDELVAYQVVEDERFAATQVNTKPVMRIPIEHKDYRCKEDQYGECSNVEEEVDDAAWKQKKFFKADFGKLSIDEFNMLPLEMTNSFTGCFGQPKDVVVKSVKIEKDAINIHIQKIWESKVQCANIQTMDDFHNLNFTLNYHYSFVKLSKLATPGYKAVNYPFADQNTYGFFTSEVKRLSADGRNTQTSNTTYLNRWSPEKTELLYYLDAGFYRDGMESIREATQQGVNTINNSLAKAGIGTRIVLADGRDKDVGDLRNNFLMLVADPQASGVIGYGPSVANPRTGEILKAQTVMYYGSMLRQIEETYDDLVEERLRAQANAASPAANVPASLPASGVDNSAAAEDIAVRHNLLARLKVLQATPVSSRPVQAVDLNSPALAQEIKTAMFSRDRKMDKSIWIERLKSDDDRMRNKAQMETMSHQCFYHESMVNWHDAVASSMEPETLGVESLKPWIELTEEEKQSVINTLMPMVWVPTLVHELGHNLGLRHNFGASEDKANYYTAEERRALGIKRDVTFASVMEYSYSTLNLLPVMGKYDIAALRFAYKRQVETKDGTLATLPEGATFEAMEAAQTRVQQNSTRRQVTASDRETAKFVGSLKEFRFCTDEHVEVNFGCQRFDEGTDFKEMALHHVKAYHKKYAKRNYRNNRARHSVFNDPGYASSVEFQFESLRRLFELYDRIANKYPGVFDQTDAQWDAQIAAAPEDIRPVIQSNREFFKGLKEAATIVADFYLDVLTTPDLHCAFGPKNSNNIGEFVPLNQISTEATSCFDEELVRSLNPTYMASNRLIGEVGKYFNHQRHKSQLPGELAAASSELSVRGIWLDKMLAIHYLTLRNLDNPVFDDQEGNFLDHAAFSGKVKEALMGFMTDSLEKEVDLRFANGATQKIKSVFKVGDTHVVKLPVQIGKFYTRQGVTGVETDFRTMLLPVVKKSLVTSRDRSSRGLLNALSVEEVQASTILNPAMVAATAEFRDPNGALLARYSATNDQELAAELIHQREDRIKLQAIERNKLITVFNNRVGNTVPAEIPEELKPAYEVDQEILYAYLTGALNSDEYLLMLFEAMAK